MNELKNFIRTVPNFPIEGVQFRDITSLANIPIALQMITSAFCAKAQEHGATSIVCIESRGFVFGTPVSYTMQLPTILARKPGKLPNKTVSKSFDLEYGSTSLEIQTCEPIDAESKVVIIDDLIATGGTAIACADLLHEHWNIPRENILICAVVDLPDLGGGEKIRKLGYKVNTLVEYEGE